MAALAVEMYVLVVIVIMAVVTETELIAYTVATVLDDMHQMMLTEERQGPEHPRLVNRQNLIFQFR